MIRILLTGAGGFVGLHLFAELKRRAGFEVIGLCRRPPPVDRPGLMVMGDLQETDLSGWCEGSDVLIHAAARAHVIKDEAAEPLEAYRRVNVDGTLRLARQAASVGVKRFIFISSIKVNGESTPLGCPYQAHDRPAPEDPYGISKLEAEQGLTRLAAETGMEVVIIRPPLVYGPGAKGNFALMVQLINKGLPLPFGAIHNQRSLVGIDNLKDLIIRCIDHPAAANQVFMAGDGQDLSTTELLQNVAAAMGKSARLFPVPMSVLQLGALVLGKRALSRRLLGSLQVDIGKARELLDWHPPYTVRQGFEQCFRRFD